MKKFLRILSIIIISSLMLLGCGSNSTKANINKDSNSINNSNEENNDTEKNNSNNENNSIDENNNTEKNDSKEGNIDQEKEKNKRRLEEAKNNIIKDIFNGKKLVFAGDMTKERNEMMELAIKYGATTATSVSGKTDLVVLGEAPGKSKVSKAEQLGIQMISEKEFFEIIEREEIV